MSTILMAVSVQLIEQEHYAQWLPYWLSYQEFYNVELSEEITLKTWARFFDEKEPIYCAVATDGKKILGFVHYLFHRSTWAESDFCYLEDLFVSPEARGCHVGKKLIDFVNQQAKQRNCARLYWHTQETNLRGQRLYDWVAEKPGVIEYRMAL
ncbi:N-acetyltransferase family protein [Proteus mirabilis]|nr:GNAT family N-acetyltransferase [Proteus mirabilis]